MQKRHTNRTCYFNEQAYTTKKYYIPYFKKHIHEKPEKVLEVGCGEGGNLLPFAQAGCKVTGIDLARTRIEQAEIFFKEQKEEGSFININILEMEGHEHSYPLIIVHDVIEHINDKLSFLLQLKNHLTPDGVIFIAFPAWRMPFGGHQQIAKGKIISHLPFIHLLPIPIYKLVLKLFNEKENVIKELLAIRSSRCSIQPFIKQTKQAGYKIINQQFYFINPNYETKFGLKPLKLYSLIARSPYIRDFFCTSCFYLLQQENT